MMRGYSEGLPHRMEASYRENMPVIAIAGAGPGLGAAVAKKFGAEGFAVALIARNPERLAALEQQLVAEGIVAKSYVADIRDHEALTTALESAAEDLGRIDVLQFSPVPSAEFLKPVLDTTVEDLRAAGELSILGSATAVRTVLPGMRTAGQGTILFPNGSSAVSPNGNVAGTSTAFAGESAYAAMLHDALKPEGVHVAQLIIPGGIDGPDPLFASESLAERLWELHAEPGAFRTTVGDES